jgi:ectoine hydroxylase-related dioxygenase (phytanoyl-CoA dioxygenase family)
MFERFDNYPQTNLRTADKETAAAYEAYMDALCEKYPKKTFLAGKGDVLLWHGMLLHGGDGVRDPALTRRSLVIHYIPPGMNRHNEIVGPTNW